MKKIVLLLMVCLFSFCCFSGCSELKQTKAINVEDEEITIQILNWDESMTSLEEPVDRVGTYTGEMIDGAPCGKGTFSSQNDEGETWTYTGTFENGIFNGYGCTEREDGSIEEGTYTNGAFTPTEEELYDVLGIYGTYTEYELSEASQSFIKENLNLFPCSTDEDKEQANSLVNPDLKYKNMAKNISKSQGELFSSGSLNVVQAFEYSLYGHDVTELLLANSSYDSYFVFIYNGVVDIYENDKVSVMGLPIAYGGFDNVSGGTTLCVTIAGCYIEKR